MPLLKESGTDCSSFWLKSIVRIQRFFRRKSSETDFKLFPPRNKNDKFSQGSNNPSRRDFNKLLLIKLLYLIQLRKSTNKPTFKSSNFKFWQLPKAPVPISDILFLARISFCSLSDVRNCPLWSQWIWLSDKSKNRTENNFDDHSVGILLKLLWEAKIRSEKLSV